MYNYTRRLCRTSVGRTFESICFFACLSVCLFVCPEHNSKERKIPKCSNLVYGMIFGYSASDMVFELKGERLRLGLGLTAMRRGFELYECLLVQNATRFYILNWLDLSLVAPSDHRPQTTCLHPALSCATASIFLQLYPKPAVHISFSRSFFQVFCGPSEILSCLPSAIPLVISVISHW